jgi:AcrR family transcriptional regulator
MLGDGMKNKTETKPKVKATGTHSREALLVSATQLFAARGFDGVSVRDIANAARVNSALVGYYFGGKQGLLAEVYTRHCTPLAQERIRLLKEFERVNGGGTLEQVLEAFIRPSLKVTIDQNGRSDFTRLRTILLGENSVLLNQLVSVNFDDSIRIFVKALSKCLPHLTREDVLWRFHFLLGAIYYTGSGPHRILVLSNGRCDPTNPDASAEEMIPFLAAGFRAPRTSRSNTDTKNSVELKRKPKTP